VETGIIMKTFNDVIGNRTRDLPACSPVPQPNAPPRAPFNKLTTFKLRAYFGFLYSFVCVFFWLGRFGELYCLHLQINELVPCVTPISVTLDAETALLFDTSEPNKLHGAQGRGKGKGKARPRTGHEGPEGE